MVFVVFSKGFLGLNELQCNDIGANFETCSSLSYETCIDCSLNDNCSEISQKFLKCFVDFNVPCVSQLECETTSGQCTDRSAVFTTGLLALCVIGRTMPIDNFSLASSIPFCPSSNDYPNGCLTKTNNKTDCELLGGQWLVPARNKEECGNAQGCYDYFEDVLYPSYPNAFNLKSKENCNYSGGEWRPYWSWNQV